VTIGSVEPMKKLFARWSDEVHLLDVMIRQAHPGSDWPPYHTFEEKLRDARRYQEEEKIPWPVLVDDLEGTVHQTYGSMADPTYLIDTDGRVSYYNMWTYAPSLHQAIQALVAQGGRGIVLGGINRVPHMLPAVTDGWRGLQRGLPQSYVDMETASPGAATATGVGYLLRPVLAPLTLRATPLPRSVKVGLALGAAGVALFGASRLLQCRRGDSRGRGTE
jgi:hypothetical protein